MAEKTLLDYVKEWIDNSNQMTDFLKTIRNAQSSLKTHLSNISGTISSVESDISKVRTEAETYLPKLGDIKTTLTNIKGVEDQIKTAMTSVSGYLSSIKDETAKLGDISTYLSNSQGFLSAMSTKLTDIKSYFTDELGTPWLEKLGKLDSLSDIVTKITDLEGTIKNLSFEVPEISLDDTALVEEMKKHTAEILSLNNTVQSMEANFQNLGNKLGILENINDNLINQITLEEYSLNLLNTNLPLFNEIMSYQTRLMKLSDLGFKILSFKVTPLEYIDQFNKIMEQTYSLSIPGLPGIEISRPEKPEKITTGPIMAEIPEDFVPVQPGDVISGDILGPGGIPDESIVSDDTFIDPDRIQEADTSLPENGLILPGPGPGSQTETETTIQVSKIIPVDQEGAIEGWIDPF